MRVDRLGALSPGPDEPRAVVAGEVGGQRQEHHGVELVKLAFISLRACRDEEAGSRRSAVAHHGAHGVEHHSAPGRTRNLVETIKDPDDGARGLDYLPAGARG